MLLVTGANGHLASAVIASLREIEGTRFAVATRNPDGPAARAVAATGIEVRHIDFDDPQTVREAMKGIEKALIVSTYSDNKVRLRQHLNAFAGARAADVGHIVYTSFINAVPGSLVEHNHMVHVHTEKALAESGVPFTILRNAMYAEMMLMDLPVTLASGRLSRPFGPDVPSTYIMRDDLGAPTAEVLTSEGHAGRTYTLTMAEAMTGAETAALMGEVFGQPVAFQQLTLDEWLDYVMTKFGMPSAMARSTLGTMQGIDAGEFATPTKDYETLTGRPAGSIRSMLERARDHGAPPPGS